MTKREMAVLACRLFSLYGFFQFLLRIEDLIGYCAGLLGMGHSYPPEVKGLLAVMGIAPVLILIFSLLIWFKVNWLAERMLPGADGSAGDFQITAKDLQIVAFSVVGLAAVMYSLPRLCGVIVDILYIPNIDRLGIGQIIREIWFRRSAPFLVEFLLGLGLLLGSRGLSGLWYTVRHAGVKDE